MIQTIPRIPYINENIQYIIYRHINSQYNQYVRFLKYRIKQTTFQSIKKLPFIDYDKFVEYTLNRDMFNIQCSHRMMYVSFTMSHILCNIEKKTLGSKLWFCYGDNSEYCNDIDVSVTDNGFVLDVFIPSCFLDVLMNDERFTLHLDSDGYEKSVKYLDRTYDYDERHKIKKVLLLNEEQYNKYSHSKRQYVLRKNKKL